MYPKLLLISFYYGISGLQKYVCECILETLSIEK